MSDSICFVRIKPLHFQLAINRIARQAKQGERIGLVIYPDQIKLKVGDSSVESVDAKAWRVQPDFDDDFLCAACWNQTKPAKLVKVRQKDGTIEEDKLCLDCVEAMQYLSGQGFELVKD